MNVYLGMYAYSAGKSTFNLPDITFLPIRLFDTIRLFDSLEYTYTFPLCAKNVTLT